MNKIDFAISLLRNASKLQYQDATKRILLYGLRRHAGDKTPFSRKDLEEEYEIAHSNINREIANCVRLELIEKVRGANLTKTGKPLSYYRLTSYGVSQASKLLLGDS